MMKRKPKPHQTETASVRKMRDVQGRSVLVENEEIVLRAALEALLLDAKQGRGSHSMIFAAPTYYDGEYITAEEAFLISQIKAIIEARPRNKLFIPKAEIRKYLKRISHIFKAAEARGEPLSAVPYLGKPQKGSSKPAESTPAKKGRKPKKGKGIKKPVVSPYDGKAYESVAAATREAQKSNPKITYNAMRFYHWYHDKNAI